ncbi:hypothetical protein [Streptomyces sp. NPDC085665]|uniref:hypothetical protein n=1 Tax=Streptomyces sp. NPDC085665 TaxID=3365735 RepID=UPI0037CFC9F4
MDDATWRRGIIARVDDGCDQEYGSSSGGRLATYLRDHRDRMFDEDRDNQERVLAWAWEVATGPIMSPGYVRLRPDIHRLRLGRDDYDGSLFAQATFPVPHHQLNGRVPYAIRDWTTGHRLSTPFPDLEEPDLSDGGSQNVYLVTGDLRIAVKGKFPYISPAAPVDEVKEALAEVVRYLNEELAPKVDAALGIEGARW